MIIKNGNVFQEDGSYKVTDLYIENGRIAASEDEVTDKTQLDAAGLKVLPGLVDIHSHGAVRHEFFRCRCGWTEKSFFSMKNHRESLPTARHP